MEISEALLAQQQVVRLQALLEASRQLHSTIEIDAVVRIALEIVVRGYRDLGEAQNGVIGELNKFVRISKAGAKSGK